jgi:hypothetical protein
MDLRLNFFMLVQVVTFWIIHSKKNQNIEYVKMFQKFSKFFTTIFLNF